MNIEDLTTKEQVAIKYMTAEEREKLMFYSKLKWRSLVVELEKLAEELGFEFERTANPNILMAFGDEKRKFGMQLLEIGLIDMRFYDFNQHRKSVYQTALSIDVVDSIPSIARKWLIDYVCDFR